MQSMKWKFEFTGPNQIFEFILYTLRWQKYFTFCVHDVTPPEKNVLRLPITLLIFIIMLLNLDTIIFKIWCVSDVISTCVHKSCKKGVSNMSKKTKEMSHD
jgi:hypothetical protein